MIGEVTDHGELRAFCTTASVVGAIPAALLTDECPRYEVEQAPSGRRQRRRADPVNDEPKTWVFEQYDQLVGSRTVRRPGPRRGGAAHRRHARHRRLARRARRSASATRSAPAGRAVMDAALNVACAGGEPLALTDCLNFGNPERPEIGWELAQAIDGIAHAANELGIPVVSGNVSLYNETGGRPIPPTPVVGCVGLVADVDADPVALAARRPRLLPPRRRRRARALRLAERAPLHARARRLRRRPRARCARRRRWSGVEAALERPDGPGVIVALATREPLGWPDVVELGTRLMCGVFGIRAPGRDVARLTYFGLHALQHRGQESAGIAVSEDGRLTGAARPRARRRRSSTSRSSRASTASSRSGTRATRRPARTPGRTRSRCSTTAARARSRSATTAT